jgi:phenylpyruvate tautomerase PptA (4-oxalocrotonate tautomerase family)
MDDQSLSENFSDEKIDSEAAMREFGLAVRERAKHLSKSSLENKYPHVAIKALWLLSQGAKRNEIKRITGVTSETLRRLEWDHNDTIESKRKEFSMRYAMAAAEFTDLIFIKAQQLMDDPDQLAQVQPDRLAATISILTDQSAKLMGMPTAKIEHVKGSSIEEAVRVIAEAKARVADKIRGEAIDAEIVE